MSQLRQLRLPLAILVIVIAAAGMLLVVRHRSQPLGEVHFIDAKEGTSDVAVASDGRLVAEFTAGSRTVVVRGPQRRFAETLLPGVDIPTDAWVRVLPEPWDPSLRQSDWFAAWYQEATDWSRDDVLAVAFEYINGAPDFYDDHGVRYRGDANFGPLSGDGRTRDIGGDFYDYLGVDWTFPAGTSKRANPDEARNVDCSGFLRLVYGYRMGIGLKFVDGPAGDLPRYANSIGRDGPGNLLAGDQSAARAYLGRLRPGDLVFFDTDGDDNWNHSGIYVGVDSRGDYRFISSRGTANGPTIADLGGESLLNGGGRYAAGFTGIRRL